MSGRPTKHNEGKTRLYTIWRTMKQRCHNPHDQAYQRYGPRGITVCDEWKTEHLEFKEWALNNGYKEGLTLDRINNDLGYSPDNCRWVTRSEQQHNRRDNRIITYNGETKTMTEWASCYGIGRGILWNRLYKLGWPFEKAVTEPARRRRPEV